MNRTLRSAAVLLLITDSVAAQDRPAKRVADIVGVALAEYEKGVDSTGRLVLPLEFEEAVAFLGQARTVASRLSGAGGDSARRALDSLTFSVTRRARPRALDRWRDLLLASLGADARLDMPERPVDLALGARLYGQHCASCHGTAAMGDGPAGKGMSPPPPALGSVEAMGAVPPAIMYRIVSVGIAGTPMGGWSERLSVEERWSIVAWLNGLRAPSAGVLAAAEGVWLQRCASCHGAKGESDGPLSTGLSELPLELASFTWQAERSDVQIALAIRDGVAGTAMPAARDLSPLEVAGVVALVRNLSLGDAPAAVGPANPDSVIRAVMRGLQFAFTSARIGRLEDAEDRALGAYLEFERIEGRGWWRNPGFVTALERRFDDFRAEVAARDFRAAQRSYRAIAQAMPEMRRLTGPPLTEAGAFGKALLIMLRKGFVAILVVGSVFALLIRTGRTSQLKLIWMAVGLALLTSALSAAVMEYVMELLPPTREIVGGATRLVAVPLLFATCFTMVSMFGAARRPDFRQEHASEALNSGVLTAFILVVFVAVYIQGGEAALLFQTLHNERSDILKELFTSVLIATVLLYSMLALLSNLASIIPWRPVLGLTSVVLFYVSFAYAGKAIRDLHQGGIMNLTVLPEWPQVDALRIFPSVETMGAQLLLLILFAFGLMKTYWPSRSVSLPTVAVVQSGDAELHLIIERLDAIERRLAMSD